MEKLSGCVTSLYSISSIVKSVGKARTAAQQRENAEINIFTVASGLLYEVRWCGLNYKAVFSHHTRDLHRS
jgi:hypothetical protein